MPYDEVCFQRIKDENPEECITTVWKCYRCDLTFKKCGCKRLNEINSPLLPIISNILK